MNSASGASPLTEDAHEHRYRVLVVDDSAVIRGILTRTLESDPSIQVIATAGNGKLAIDAVRRHDVEVVVLDIEMPVMDGLTALPQMIAVNPALKVIVASTLTNENARLGVSALESGAADWIAKPTSSSALNPAESFGRDLVAKVIALGQAHRRGRHPLPGPLAVRRAGVPAIAPQPARPNSAASTRPLTLRRLSPGVPRVLTIASSTGGPQALFTLLGALSPRFVLPVLIAQHMPTAFTTILADHLRKQTNRPCAEGVDGEPVRPGHIYVAPGGHHMVVERHGDQVVVRLNQDAPENFCRPAADPLLRSIAAAYGSAVLAIVLTGMGQDGLVGCRSVVEAGGNVLAQDQQTSVVWGMPGAVATAGLCSAVLPIDRIASQIETIAEGRVQ